MAVQPGRHQLCPEHGKIILHTSREGMASQAGHDLTIEVRRWSGELTVSDDLSPAGLDVRIDLGSLAVLEGTGGLKPLTDKDRREIVTTAQKVLHTDRHPEARFTAAEFRPDTDGGGVITGTLALAGNPAPLRLVVRQTAPDHYHAAGEVVQSEHGITPYRGFLGALRVRDAVAVDADVRLGHAAPGAGEPGGPRSSSA
jgi:polyisoprenoid-binding protein YceI